jgi:hypothetical protein
MPRSWRSGTGVGIMCYILACKSKKCSNSIEIKNKVHQYDLLGFWRV